MITKRHRIEIRGIPVDVVRKEIKNLHVGVYPPDGRVRVAAPLRLDDDAVRLAVSSRLGWIRRQQAGFGQQDRQSEQELVTGESHYFQGRRYRLDVIEHDPDGSRDECGPSATAHSPVARAGGSSTNGRARPSTTCNTRRTSCCSPCSGGCATSSGFRDIAEMLLERGFSVTHETIREWECRFAPRVTERLSARSVGAAPAAPGTWTRPP